MPTTAYLAGTDSNDTELSYGAESVWGTSPVGSGAYHKFRVNSESFAEEKNRTRPPEIRADGMSAAAVTQDLRARGGIQFGVSFGNVDDLIAAALMGAWAADLALVGVAGDITFVAATSKITSTTAGKFTNVVVGQWIKTAGATNAGNNGWFRVTVKTSATDITVAGATFVNETPTGAAVTIKGSHLRNALIVNTYSIQKRWGASLGFIYPGCFFSGGQLNAQRGQFFSGTLDAICKAETKAAAEVGSNPVAAPTAKVMNTVGHFKGLNIDGVATTSKIMSLNTNFTRTGADMAFALGSASAQGIGSKGTLDVSGTMEIYFADYDLYDDYVAETPLHVSYRVEDTAGNAYVVTIPEMVLGKSTIVAGGPNQPVMARFDWQADPDPALAYMISIDRVAA